MTSRASALLFGATKHHGWPTAEHLPIAQHAEALRRAGVEEIALVASSGAGAAASRLQHVRVVLHSGAWDSAFDEIVLGLFALGRGPVLILPAEHEIVAEETLALLLAEAQRPEASHAIVPVYDKQSGYPIVLLQQGIDAVVREAANPRGLRKLELLLESWKDAVRALAVADQTVRDGPEAPL